MPAKPVAAVWRCNESLLSEQTSRFFHFESIFDWQKAQTPSRTVKNKRVYLIEWHTPPSCLKIYIPPTGGWRPNPHPTDQKLHGKRDQWSHLLRSSALICNTKEREREEKRREKREERQEDRREEKRREEKRKEEKRREEKRREEKRRT